jgi:hypothetical protein
LGELRDGRYPAHCFDRQVLASSVIAISPLAGNDVVIVSHASRPPPLHRKPSG